MKTTPGLVALAFGVALAAVGAASVAGCALPSRDNPTDPSVAPAAELAVIDTTLPDGSCPAESVVLGSASWPTVSAISRGHCLALDARGTTSPKGKTVFHFRFTRIDPVTGDVVDLPAASVSDPTTGIAVLGTDLRINTLVPGVAATFRVDAFDGSGFDGAHGHATTTLTLLNGAPTANAGPSRSVPAGNWPWMHGQPYDLLFSGAGSGDPDHDRLSYCWTFLSGGVTTTLPCTEAETVTHTASSTAQTLIATLVVKDGFLESPPAVTEVKIGDENVWARPDGLGDFELLGPSMSIPVGGDLLTDARELPNDRVAFLQSPGASPDLEVDVTAFPYGTPLDSATIPAQDFGTIAASDDGSLLWTVTEHQFGPLAVIATAFSVDGAGQLTELAQTPPLTSAAGAGQTFSWDYRFGAVVIDDAGVGYATTPDNTLLCQFSKQTSPATFTCNATPGRAYAALTKRPGTPEIWAVQVTDAQDPQAPVAAASIVRILPGGTDEIPLKLNQDEDVAYVGAMQWISADELWIALPGEIRRVDANLLAAGATLEDATLLRVIVQDTPKKIVVDALTGTAYVSSTANVVYRVSLSGDAVGYPDFDDPRFVDHDGILWHRDFNHIPTLVRGGPERDAVVRRIHYPFFAQPSVDPSTGGLLVTVNAPGAIERFAEDGTLLSHITSAQVGGVEGPAPLMIGSEVSPDGNSVWAVSAYAGSLTNPSAPPTILGVVRWDLTQDPPAGQVVLGTAGMATLSGSSVGASDPGQFLAPGSPAGGAAPFAWATQYISSTQRRVVTVGLDGTITPIFTIPTAEDPTGIEGHAQAALLPASNDLCLASFDPGTATLRVRRMTTGGTVTTLGTETIAGGTRLAGISGALDASGNDVCWAVVDTVIGPGAAGDCAARGTSHVRAWQAAGAALRSVDLDGPARGIRGSSENRAWLLLDCNETDSELSLSIFKKAQLDYDGSVYVPRVYGGTYADHLIVPGADNR